MDTLKNAVVLLADDDPSTRRLLRRVMEREGARVTEAADGRSVLRFAKTQPFDLVLLDVEMPGMDGLETLRQLRVFDPDLPVLMVSGVATIPISVQATRLGAFDFIEKPVDIGRLARLARHAVKQQRLTEAARAAIPQDPEQDCCADLVGRSSELVRAKQQIRRISRYDVPVLVHGESGVGKELVARAIHKGSPRADGPYVAFNAAAVPDTLFESTLFGHVRGSFTGADRANSGLMLAADGGTLVLDEIGDLAMGNQVKLLRALETSTVLAVGATAPRPTDVRVVACTNADLIERIAAGEFRADLYYRLRGVSVTIPALRERQPDIPDLANHFLAQARQRYDVDVAGFEPDVIERFAEYHWPGNVRELMHVVMSAALMATARWIGTWDLPEEIRSGPPDAKSTPEPIGDFTLRAAERRHIERVLRVADNNRTAAARLLGVSRSSFYRMLTKHGLD